MDSAPDFSKIKLLALDFDGVMTDNIVYVSQDGKEQVACNRLDGYGINMLKDAKIHVIVISRETNPVVRARCEKLGIPCISAVMEKTDILEKEVKKRGLTLDDVCFVGNDIPDIECMLSSQIGVCVADGIPAAIDSADYVTKARGGCGAVREIADLILR